MGHGFHSYVKNGQRVSQDFPSFSFVFHVVVYDPKGEHNWVCSKRCDLHPGIGCKHSANHFWGPSFGFGSILLNEKGTVAAMAPEELGFARDFRPPHDDRSCGGTPPCASAQHMVLGWSPMKPRWPTKLGKNYLGYCKLRKNIWMVEQCWTRWTLKRMEKIWDIIRYTCHILTLDMSTASLKVLNRHAWVVADPLAHRICWRHVEMFADCFS